MISSTDKNLYIHDARFYDLDPRDILKADIPFYLRWASIIGGPLLELACGTGRITIPLAEAGHEVWALEFSETMLEQFRNKMKDIQKETAGNIHLVHGDMSHFQLDREFPLIILPCRSFQLLYEETKEKSCLKCVYTHLASNGYFIIDIGNFVPNKEKESAWVSSEEFFDWENIDPKTGCKIQRTHTRKEIDINRQIIYPHKKFIITNPNGTVQKVEKRSPWKYFFIDQVRNLLMTNGFKLVAEMGYYDGRPIQEKESEFLFICQKI
ncbi:MAG: class I SAM-dependent methyltransferase [Acidobacteria bacterium]|jgi:SAM-dependent methyltransferase|nr:class I SAM-dependent methyltransferase [Acidobacteriota bacterium]